MELKLKTENLKNSQKLLLYAHFRRNLLNHFGIFSDETENFRIPSEPMPNENVKFILRTGKNNVDSASIFIGNDEIALEKEYTEIYFDYYCATIKCPESEQNYYFKIYKNNEIFFYNKKGLFNYVDENYNFTVIPGFKTPDWAKGALMYQIYVDRFYNGNPTNDVVDYEYVYLGKPAKKISNWNEAPHSEDIRNFYGGDLQGVMDKMTYLKDLGVECIYLNPIFVSPSNHKYDIQDYDYVDPHFGVIIKDSGCPLQFEKFRNRFATMYIERTTNKENLEASNAFFIKLVESAHENGIKIILDGVFNHCGAFNKWLDREGIYKIAGYPTGAYTEKCSEYHDFFKWYDVENWPNNDAYDGWWGYDNHPKLNFENSPKLYEYILEIGRKWVSPPFNCDGWRLDVAADLGYSKEFNHKFWCDFRNAVKEANPEAIILAEHYGDPKDWLRGNQWDTVMNYDAFMEPLTYFLTGMEKHSEEFREDLLCNEKAFEGAMRYHMAKHTISSLQIAMNQLSNHDHSRFLTRTNMTVGRLHTKGSKAADENLNMGIMKEAVTFQMTWPGAPTIYYGDEVGVSGWTDPDNRRTYPWGNENMELLNYHKEIIKIHKKFNTLRIGSLEYLLLEYGFLSYGRFDKDNKIVVAINNNYFEKTVSLPVWRIGIKPQSKLKVLIYSYEDGFSTEEKTYDVIDGKVAIALPKFSSIIMLEE